MADVEIEQDDLELQTFVNDWIEAGFNSTRAYLKRHNVTEHSARVLGCRMLAKVSIPEVLEARGLGYETYYKKLQEGLDATKTVSGIGDADSKSIEFVDVPDFKVRREYHKALGKALKLEIDRSEVDNRHTFAQPIFGGKSNVPTDNSNSQDIQPTKEN